jgi:hypothetical protein
VSSHNSLRIKSTGDLILGLAFMSLAAAALFLLRNLPAGTADQMGPAYFPRMLAVILLFLGGAITFKSFMIAGAHQLRVRVLPLLFVVAGTVFFGVAAEQLGCVITVFGMVVIYAFAYPGKRIWETLFLALGCAAFSAVLFVFALGLPLTIWPRFLGE